MATPLSVSCQLQPIFVRLAHAQDARPPRQRRTTGGERPTSRVAHEGPGCPPRARVCHREALALNSYTCAGVPLAFGWPASASGEIARPCVTLRDPARRWGGQACKQEGWGRMPSSARSGGKPGRPPVAQGSRQDRPAATGEAILVAGRRRRRAESVAPTLFAMFVVFSRGGNGLGASAEDNAPCIFSRRTSQIQSSQRDPKKAP